MEIVDKRCIVCYKGWSANEERRFIDTESGKSFNFKTNAVLGDSILEVGKNYSMRCLPSGNCVIEGYA